MGSGWRTTKGPFILFADRQQVQQVHSLYRCRRHNKMSANRQLLDVPTIRLICNRVIFIAVTVGGVTDVILSVTRR